MKQTLPLLVALAMTAVTATAQVGIGTTSPVTTLHLYESNAHPVLRLESGTSVADGESGRVEWTYKMASTARGFSVRVHDQALEINRLESSTLNVEDDVAAVIRPESIAINVNETGSPVTTAATLSVNGSLAAGNRTINTDLTMPANGQSEDYVILADATAGNITVTLCSAVGQKGRLLVVKKIAGGNIVYIEGYSNEMIDGSYTYGLSALFQYVSLQSDGMNWYIIGK